ncbi:MAG TPA: hypothetical protein VIG64_03950 [Actinomycetota bacterium]
MTEEAGRAARYHDLFENGHEHKSDCAYCPICATIAVLRQTKPEVLEHLAAAARELIVAAGILLEEAGSFVGAPETDNGDGSSAANGADGAKVRRIDIG